MRELLPVGSLIRVKGHEEKYLIVGKYIKVDDQTMYDYMCVVYPYGYYENFDFLYLNDENVETLVFLGNINY